ncbi:protein of unknown function DUF202 [Chloroherpeton thalassium ATCC 35110]|uniref:DUF202 domain-containing protein n=1 Tax=Chloroherpeton thalassium (strain ATCC 35110 / GB-78) TaxID=517418 RepID=B3QSU7_CHLT3|nr:DUF202 domain-containing protein [Chloroherpeton thalassium]ACF12590.1 protein of unknown function DUF202 [Chloroherpeton thalassium ATCC 35110]
MAYSKFHPDDLILRDLLARDRTVLANERTLLAYIRTAVGILFTGGTLIKFYHDILHFVILGAVLIFLSFVVAVLGGVRFFQVRGRLETIERIPEPHEMIQRQEKGALENV